MLTKLGIVEWELGKIDGGITFIIVLYSNHDFPKLCRNLGNHWGEVRDIVMVRITFIIKGDKGTEPYSNVGLAEGFFL